MQDFNRGRRSWLTIFDCNAEDAELFDFPAPVDREPEAVHFLMEIMAMKTAMVRMGKNVFCNTILIQARIQFFEKETSPWFKDPFDLAKGASPVRDMMEHAETEDHVHRATAEREIMPVCRSQGYMFHNVCRNIPNGFFQHIKVEICHIKGARLKCIENKFGRSAPAASYLKAPGPGLQRHQSGKFFYFDVLLDHPQRVIDDPALCPIQFHLFISFMYGHYAVRQKPVCHVPKTCIGKDSGKFIGAGEKSYGFR